MGGCCTNCKVGPATPTIYTPTSPPTKQDPTDLTTIVYVSRMVPGYFEDPKSLDRMVRFADANNRAIGLSGYLLVAPPYFLQRLEGARDDLIALTSGIKKDYRHDNFIVVEERSIAQRSYGNWSMRTFDLVKTSGTKFEAVSFILQSLSQGLAVASKTIHPACFQTMLAGKELSLQDEVQDMIVVTVSLGADVMRVGPEGKLVADTPFICSLVDFLSKRVCPLNPEGRGLLSLLGGTVLQVAVAAHRSPNLENKVVRACLEIATGQGEKPPSQIRVHVGAGKVHVKYLPAGEDLRKGRYLYGEPMTHGVEAAKALLEGSNLVVIESAIQQRLRDEFILESAGRGTFAVVATTLKPSTAVMVGPGRAVRSCEGALAALMAYREDRERPAEDWGLRAISTVGPRAASSVESNNPEDETDLEWMYQLDNLSKAYAKAMSKKKRFAAKRGAPRTGPGSARSKSIASLSSHTCQLLNIIYMSTMSPDRPMTSEEITELGAKASKANAKLGITGFLLYTKPFFLQYLEGPPAQVKDLFARIRTDPRHGSVVVVASRILRDGSRNFGAWNMETADLDAETAQETAPLREVLRLLSRQFQQLQSWLPRLQHDILLTSTALQPGCYAQCALVAFAALPRKAAKSEKQEGPMLASLVGFLSRGGEVLGFVGDCLVGYAFAVNLDMLVDEVADLCADFKVHVGIAAGPMLLLNAGLQRDDCQLSFYGPLFERATTLAARAAKLSCAIVADPSCEVPVASVSWRRVDAVVVGQVEV